MQKSLKEVDVLTMKSIQQNLDKALEKITDKVGPPTDKEQMNSDEEDELDDDDDFIKFLRYDYFKIFERLTYKIRSEK